MTRDDPSNDQSRMNSGNKLTTESSDAMAPLQRRKKANPAERHKRRRRTIPGEAEPGGDGRMSANTSQPDGGFDIPVGDSGAVVRSAWRFGG
jgi:hypothetical protein